MSSRKVRRQGAMSLARAIVAAKTRHGTTKDELGDEANAWIRSIGTERGYRQAVCNLIRWLRASGLPSTQSDISLPILMEFLEYRATRFRQKTVDRDRQALKLVFNAELPFVLAEMTGEDEPRTYAHEQIQHLAHVASDRLKRSIKIGTDTGIRAHEFLTLAPAEAFPESDRSWHPARFWGRHDYSLYRVHGKGGLRRTVAMSRVLADELERVRLPRPELVVDREIKYLRYYDLLGGQPLSKAFSTLSKRELGFSTGAHALRYRYAEDRFLCVTNGEFLFDPALSIVATELGHFSSRTTLRYLRGLLPS